MLNLKNFFKIIIVIAFATIIAFAITGCGKKDNNSEENEEVSYEQPIIDYFEGIKNRDVERLKGAFPDFIENVKSTTQEDIDQKYLDLESVYGANVNIDYKIGEATLLDEEELEELKQNMAAVYSSIDTSKLTSSYIVPTTVTISGDGVAENTTEGVVDTSSENEAENSDTEDASINEDSDDITYYVIQYDGNWYML